MFSLLTFFPSLFNIAEKIVVCTHKLSTKQNQSFQVGTAMQKDILESPVICKHTAIFSHSVVKVFNSQMLSPFSL